MEYQFLYLGWAKAAYSNLFGPWIMGAAMFIQDARGKFNALETLEMLHKYPITTLCAPPTAYRMMVLDEPMAYLKANPPKALRYCTGAGEPLNPEVIKIWRDVTGMTIRDGYGQTETVILCANFPPLEVKPGSMGKPSPGFDVSVSSRSVQYGCLRNTGATRMRPAPAFAVTGTSPATVPTRTKMATSGLWDEPMM